jgi:hypothetical protein
MSEKITERRHEVALQTRNFEIELFWKRSAFFWAFITAAFAGYAALRNFRSDLSVVVACFGAVCALAWTLANRGSKYWQETWETRVEKHESVVTGALFGAEDEAIQTNKGCWLQARRYSVSKLTIALSDYVFALWIAVIGVGTSASLCPYYSAELAQRSWPNCVRDRLGLISRSVVDIWSI